MTQIKIDEIKIVDKIADIERTIELPVTPLRVTEQLERQRKIDSICQQVYLTVDIMTRSYIDHLNETIRKIVEHELGEKL